METTWSWPDVPINVTVRIVADVAMITVWAWYCVLLLPMPICHGSTTVLIHHGSITVLVHTITHVADTVIVVTIQVMIAVGHLLSGSLL